MLCLVLLGRKKEKKTEGKPKKGNGRGAFFTLH
jgi:hypothetical protein